MIRLTIITFAFSVSAIAAPRTASPYTLTTEVSEGGGGTASSTNYSTSTVVVADVPALGTSTHYRLQTGFLSEPLTSSIAARHVFYNDSAFDNSSGANTSDDQAIATDKSMLTTGNTATFANYSSYVHGINGVMIDIQNLAEYPAVTDFEFRTGNDQTPGSWSAAPSPILVEARAGAGIGGSDRVTLIWNNNNGDSTIDSNEAVAKSWLQVTAKANSGLGIETADIFYFGNAIGETNNDTANARVNSADLVRIRNNATATATIDRVHDINRDGAVNVQDRTIARQNISNFLNELVLLDLTGNGGLQPASVASERLDLWPEQERRESRPQLAFQPDGTAVLHFTGTPDRWYTIYASETLNDPQWIPIAEITDEVEPGLFEFTDTETHSPKKFYQIVLQSSPSGQLEPR